MPLLHKQKFVRAEIPADLDPKQEVFFSKLTQEIFLDYDQYFERTILCNSLVWTCSLTGRSGFTFAEALESEKKAKQMISTFPAPFEKWIVFLILLTKRSNIKDLNEDLFSFVKDRFYMGEQVNVANISDSNKVGKVVDILLPTSHHDHSDKSTSKSKQHVEQADPMKIKYVVEIESKINGATSRHTVKAAQLSRSKNLLTKEKIYIIIKTYCEVTLMNSVWTVTPAAKAKLNLSQTKFSEFFKGEPPQFEATYGRGQFSRSQQNKSLNTTKSPAASGSKKATLNNSTSSAKTSSHNNSKQSGGQKNTSISELNTKNKSKSTGGSLKSQTSTSKLKMNQTSTNSTDDESEGEVMAQKILSVLSKNVCQMNKEEFYLWRDYVSDDSLREIELIEAEMEKIAKREEKEKEKERIKQEKNKQKEYLKELKKPKEDLECDDLVELPRGMPVQSKISHEMFADAAMILEFLNNFGDLFELRNDFPNGFSLELLENALFSKSCDSALCNLLLFFLDSVFKCYNEEKFDDGTSADSDTEHDDEQQAPHDSNDSHADMDLDQLYNIGHIDKSTMDREAFAELAESYAKLVKSVQGRAFKSIGLDVYTITEMLRLYFATSGSAHDFKTKFWYQQRGGYTRMDEVGIDFSLNESQILKKLEITLVYELEPDEKLKILSSLCHQLMSQVRFRDLIEDNWHKLTVCKAQLRDLQTEENRRLREETSERWKKRNQDRAKTKARLEEIKTNILSSEQARDDSNASMENMKQLEDVQSTKMLNESNKKRAEFLKKEKHIMDDINQLQSKCAMCPIGKDRYFRRYWVFKTLPGLFVEDNDSGDEQLDSLLKEHLSNKSIQMDQGIVESQANSINGKENKPQINDLINQGLKLMNEDFISNKKTAPYVKGEIRWSFYYTNDDLECLLANLNERGVRESELKQSLLDHKEKIIEQFNAKNFLIKHLTLTKEEIEKSIQNCLKENITNILVNSLANNPKQNKRQATKSVTASLTGENFCTLTSNKHLEADLKDKLLDIEEQIFAGFLGSLKVTDRAKWKEALENSSFDPQCDYLCWGDTKTPATAYTLTAHADHRDQLECVNKFAKALLQIEQAVEKRFLRTPLGECQNTPSKKRTKPSASASHENTDTEEASDMSKYPTLQYWEKSLMHCTNLSQLFVHLQSLDESIAWAKSVMNARCRLCRKGQKSDADRMILCDKCDKGHHIFCLRPALKCVPTGKWLCPECRPIDVERTPRKIRETFHNGDLYSDDAVNTEASNDESTEHSDDTSDAKSDVSVAPKKRRVQKMIVESDENVQVEEEEQDDEEMEQDGEEGEDSQLDDDQKNNESEVSDDDEDDEDYTIKKPVKSKIKVNTFNGKNKKNIFTDEEITVDDSTTDDNNESNKRRSKKRKLSGEKVSSKSLKTTKVESSRHSRGKKPVYNELSDEDLTETDDDFGKNTKRTKNKVNEFGLNNTSSRNTEMAHRRKVVETLLNDLMKNPDCWPFLKPVSRRHAPDYFEIIKTPMDFSTIKNNINNFKYTDYTQIIEDTRLVFNNCFEYNEPGSEIYKTGKQLSKYFESHAKQAGLLDYN